LPGVDTEVEGLIEILEDLFVLYLVLYFELRVHLIELINRTLLWLRFMATIRLLGILLNAIACLSPELLRKESFQPELRYLNSTPAALINEFMLVLNEFNRTSGFHASQQLRINDNWYI
jgi:hypothetical protein